MALKEANAGLPWTQWTHCTDPDPVAVAAYKFLQWQFFRQWQALKQYCHDRGIRLIGDLPIYVAHDSADVWGHPVLFALDDGPPRRSLVSRQTILVRQDSGGKPSVPLGRHG